MYKSKVPNPNNQRTGAPLWPIAGIPITGPNNEVYHINIYPGMPPMCEHEGKGKPFPMAKLFKIAKNHFNSKE